MVNWLARHFGEKCPFCGQRGQVLLESSEETGSEDGYETVTREDKIKNDEGEVTGTIEREEQIHVVRTNLLNHYKCSSCGEAWDTESEEVEED